MKVCVMLFHMVSYENMNFLQGFCNIWKFYLSETATDVAPCTQFMKCTDFLVIVVS